MMKVMIWDVPIRVFHWLFALCAGAALAIGMLAGDESAVFPLHKLFGMSACFLLVVRLALGIFGGRHNRFRALFFSPLEIFRYLGGAVTGSGARYVVHNPGAAAAAVGMFLVVALLVWSGLGYAGEAGETLHQILGYALLALVAAHIAGLTIHTLKHRENIALSMVTGSKAGPPELALRSTQPILGVVVLVIAAAWMGSLFTSYDGATKTVVVPVVGKMIQLGEQD
jgi:cytochrome b